MATIKQIVDFMNEMKITWHPNAVVEVESYDKPIPGLQGYEGGKIKGDTLIYIKQNCQPYIGHYFVDYENKDITKGVMLLPLSTGKYLKAKFNISV